MGRKKKKIIPTVIQMDIMKRERKTMDVEKYVLHPKMDGLGVYKVELKTGKAEII